MSHLMTKPTKWLCAQWRLRSAWASGLSTIFWKIIASLWVYMLSLLFLYIYDTKYGYVRNMAHQFQTMLNIFHQYNWAATWKKTNNVTVRPAKTQVSLGIRPVWSESLLCAQWVAKDPSFLHVHSKDSDQTGWMPRLIWVFAGHTVTLLVLSCPAQLFKP